MYNDDHQRWVMDLIRWYQRDQRDLPWRQRKDPYGIWISEIMLQQTRVETVIAYYERFMHRFPTIYDVAKSPLEDILKLWEGLGYYSRARNIHKTAVLIVEQYKGVFPKTYEEVISLPGIGPYTAGAILSIAYNQAYPAVDGNVLRVISRLFLVEKDITLQSTKREIEDIVRYYIPEGAASDFTQAIMELGALICIPTSPRCSQCPIQENCKAFIQGEEQNLPIKAKKAKPKIENRYIAVIYKGDSVLMNQRKEGGLLGGLWEFPGVQAENKKEFVEKFQKKYGLVIQPESLLLKTEHTFTHRHWKMKVYKCTLSSFDSMMPTMQWATVSIMEKLTIPTAYQAILQKVL